MAGTITLGTGSAVNFPTYIFTYDSGGAGYSANLKDSTAFDLFPDAFSVNDFIAFGSTKPVLFINVTINEAMAATSYTLIWEYYAWEAGAGVWLDITSDVVDGTSGFTASGTIDFTNVVWANVRYSSTINSTAAYFVLRCKVTAVDTPTAGGSVSAAITQEPQVIYLTGFTDSGAPCTLENIYDEMVGTYGSTICTQIDNLSASYSDWDTYYFIPYPIEMLSTTPQYVSTQREKVVIGCGSGYLCFYGISLLSGLITNDGFTYNGSTLVFNGFYYYYGTQVYIIQNSKIYDSHLYKASYTNPKTGNTGSYMGYFGYAAPSGTAPIVQDSYHEMDFYYSNATFTNCFIEGTLLAYGTPGSYNGVTIFKRAGFAGFLTCYNNISFLLANSKIQSPTTYWAYHYQTSTSAIKIIFQDCTPKCPEQNATPYTFGRAADQATGAWHGYETHTVKFTVTNEEGTALTGVKLTASQKNNTTGAWTDVTFYKRNDKTLGTSATILTSDANGYFDKAGDGNIYVIPVMDFYYDAVNSEGYPAYDSIVSKNLRRTKFTFQLQGYETKIISMQIGENDDNSEMILPKGIVTLKRSPYANR